MEKKTTRWISFVGGRNLIFTLAALLLLGLVLLVYHQLDFLFEPIGTIFQTIIGPIIMTMILYYVFNPIVNYFEKKGVKRVITVVGIFVLLITLIVVSVVLVEPIIQNQVEALIRDFPKYVDETSDLLTNFFRHSAIEAPLQDALDKLQNWTDGLSDKLGGYVTGVIQGASNVVSHITSAFLILVTAPIITFFLLKDDQKFFGYVLKIIPPRFREDAQEIAGAMNSQVGAYLKGQIAVSIAIGLMTFIGFAIIGMPYSGTLAIVTGVTAIIPYIGPVVAFIPALIIALLHSFPMLVKMCIVWMLVQMLNGHIVQPAMMGKRLLMHPITIIIVLLVMGDLLGVFGLIFGIPVYAIFKVLVVYAFRKFKMRYNRFYGEKGRYEDLESLEEEFGSGVKKEQKS